MEQQVVLNRDFAVIRDHVRDSDESHATMKLEVMKLEDKLNQDSLLQRQRLNHIQRTFKVSVGQNVRGAVMASIMGTFYRLTLFSLIPYQIFAHALEVDLPPVSFE